ncbi:MAG TPA: hypothetical protein VH351_08465 [Bryobacteraceae bacterium]|nr:hypothetical protein [Bryobacteraceae bacterium]
MSSRRVGNGVLRNSRKTGVVDSESRTTPQTGCALDSESRITPQTGCAPNKPPPQDAANTLRAWRRPSARFTLLSLIVLVAAGSASQALAADITAIPTPSYASTYASGINDLGQVVGGVMATHSGSCPPPEISICTFPVGTAFIYSHGRVTYEGDGCDTYDCFGNGFSAINNSGQSVGIASGQATFYHGVGTWERAFLFSGGRSTGIPPIESGLFADFNEASAINASGMVVGASDYTGIPFSPQHAFLYSGGQTTDLGDLAGGNYEGTQSVANAINDRGQIAGVSDTKSGAQHAFLYSNGKMSDLGSLGGNSTALGINNAGEIVGTAGNRAFIVILNPLSVPRNLNGANTAPDQAWIYLNGKMIDIGDGAAQAINQAGEVVGTSDGFAFLYVNGKMIDLNSLLPENSGWQVQDATAINNYGVVVGEGTYNGQERAFVLYTTPEPVPPALLGIGIVCLGLLRKRSHQHSI